MTKTAPAASIGLEIFFLAYLSVLWYNPQKNGGEALGADKEFLTDSMDLPASQRPAESQKEIKGKLELTAEQEQMLLSLVEHGRSDQLRQLIRGFPQERAEASALRRQKNLLICMTALVTRAAIRGGLGREHALALSDLYIQKAEQVTCGCELDFLSAQMALDFAQRVEQEKTGIHHSKRMRAVRDYVQSHIGELITTGALAKHTGLNRTYLCKLFVQETGMTVSQYVTGMKMEEAKRLLDVSHKSIAEIAGFLGYSSQSHFQRVFKKTFGLTPGEYKTGTEGKKPKRTKKRNQKEE